MRFLRAVLSAVVATLPVLVVLLIPALVRGNADDVSLVGIGSTLLNAAFLAAIILVPKVNGWLDPETPGWTSATAMSAVGEVWRTRIWLALLAVLALLAIYAAGQTAAYFVGQGAPAVSEGALDYRRFLVQEMTVYLLGFVLSLTTYLLIVRTLARSTR